MSVAATQDKNIATLQSEGKDAKRAFADGARGLFHLLYDIDAIRDDERVEFAVEAESMSALYHAWLSELLARSEQEKLVFGEFLVMSVQKVSAKQYVLMGSASGEKTEGHQKRTGVVKIKTEKTTCKETTEKCSCSAVIELA